MEELIKKDKLKAVNDLFLEVSVFTFAEKQNESFLNKTNASSFISMIKHKKKLLTKYSKYINLIYANCDIETKAVLIDLITILRKDLIPILKTINAKNIEIALGIDNTLVKYEIEEFRKEICILQYDLVRKIMLSFPPIRHNPSYAAYLI